jgi:hypothetical protein
MKRMLLLYVLLISIITNIFTQETTKPLTDTKVVRKVSMLDIEGVIYENVVVTMKSISPNYFFSDIYKVKVTIVDLGGNRIWKKTLKNVFLYVFSDGQVQVGKNNFTQVLINKSSYSGLINGKIREKEGVF